MASKASVVQGPAPFTQAYSYVMSTLDSIEIQIEGQTWRMYPILVDKLPVRVALERLS